MNVFNGIRARIQNAHPDHHAIARGMAVVIFFVFLGKIAGAAKEMAIAYRYGVSVEVDTYLFVFNLVSWPVSVWFAVLTVVLVPLAARIRQDAPLELPRFRSEMLGLSLLLGIGIMLFALWGLPLLLRSPLSGIPETFIVIATSMVVPLSLVGSLGVLISLLSVWMMASGRQFNTLLESVPAVVLLAAVLIFPYGGAELLVWATLVGAAIHFLSLAALLKRRGELEAPAFILKSQEWQVFMEGFGIMLAGQTLMSLISIIDQFFAAQLGTGAISTINYANRILALILGLGATAVARATLPVFSQSQAKLGNDLHLRGLAIQWVCIMFLLGLTAMTVGWFLAPWMVRTIFERGAFMAKNTQSVAAVLQYGLVQLPFYFSGLVLVSLLASQQKHKLIAIGAIANLFVKIIANLCLFPFMGVNGIVLATAVMYMFSFALLNWFVRAQLMQAHVLQCNQANKKINL